MSVVDPQLFKDLSQQDPAGICGRTGARFDPATGRYEIDIWNGRYVIDPAGQTVDCTTPENANANAYFPVFIIHYLLTKQPVSVSCEWVSEKDLPGGSAFFTVSHDLPCHLIVDACNNDIQGFQARCRNLGGTPLDMADAAFFFEVTPRIPVAVLYWLGDEDFPPEARLLFDRSIRVYALDVVYALAVEVCWRVGK